MVPSSGRYGRTGKEEGTFFLPPPPGRWNRKGVVMGLPRNESV